MVGGLLVAGQWWLDERRAVLDRDLEEARASTAERLEDQRAVAAARLENLRYVRDGSAHPIDGQSFKALDLVRTNLSDLHLAHANFDRANLSFADLVDTDLREAKLRRAQLAGATLAYSDLHLADFAGASLEGADLYSANMKRTRLPGVNLRGADLSDALMAHSDLFSADLTGANLSGTNLSNSDLRLATLAGICYDERTKWPEGVEPPPSTESACFSPDYRTGDKAAPLLIGKWISTDPGDALQTYRFFETGKYESVGSIWLKRKNGVFEFTILSEGVYQVDDNTLRVIPEHSTSTTRDPDYPEENETNEPFKEKPDLYEWFVDGKGLLHLRSEFGDQRFERQAG